MIEIKCHKFLILFIFSTSCYLEAEEKNNYYNVSCRIFFKVNKFQFAKEEVTDCLKKIPTELISSVNIIGSASTEGPKEFNKILAKNRAQVITEELSKQLPSAVKIYSEGVGADRFWRRSTVIRFILKEKIEREITQTDVIKKSEEMTETKISDQAQQITTNSNQSYAWLGAIALFAPKLYKYADTPMYGFEVGVRKKLYDFDEDLSFYPALIVEQANGSRQNSDLGQNTAGENNRGKFSLSNVSLLAGAEYKLTTNFSLFFELGPTYTQRTIILANSSDQSISSYQYNGLAASMNFGGNIYFPISTNLELFIRTGVDFTFGPAQKRAVYKTATESNNVDINSYMFAPSLSLGVKF